MSLKPLLGQRALITGGSKGIGGGIASKLASLGCQVTLMSRNINNLKTKVHELNNEYPNNEEHQWHSFDLKCSYDLESFLKTNIQYEKINILINCAGQSQKRLLVSTSIDEISSITNVNLISPMILCKLFARSMSKTNIANPHIVNISSIVAQSDHTLVGASVYSASKSGLWTFSNTLKAEMALSKRGKNIGVHCILPGHVPDTDIGATVDLTSSVAGAPNGEWSVARVAEEVAQVVILPK